MTQGELVQLFQPHAQNLERFLTRRLGCPQTAADLLQETRLRLI
ncbi:MAG: sigma factor [Nitrospiraceae bacterium]